MSEESKFDAEQQRLMAEEVILVDWHDKPIGPASKRISHLNENIRAGMLHRAFSVFLFNSEGKLLLQQRSGAKITFPLHWANTCCSHPLYFAEEMEETEALGVKRAAQRKLEHELGIAKNALSFNDFKYLTKIYYKAESDGEWGEHEIDWILFVKKDVDLALNDNEVNTAKYVDADELREMFKLQEQGKLHFSPWFHMIAEKFLFGWWEKLDSIIKGELIVDGTWQEKPIHRLKLKYDDEAAPQMAA